MRFVVREMRGGCGEDLGGCAGSGTCGRLTRALIAVRYELEASVATGLKSPNGEMHRRKAGAEVGRGAKPPPFSAPGWGDGEVEKLILRIERPGGPPSALDGRPSARCR